MTTERIKLGSILYSYTTEYHTGRYSFEGLVREVAARNLGPGLEVVGFQSFRDFPDVTEDTAARFRDLVAETGLVPTALGSNADVQIARDRRMTREELTEYHERQLRSAARLGFPVMRYQHGASPEVIERLAPLAEDLGVKLGLEIHAPQSPSHPAVMAYREMHDRVNSPALGFIPDFGATAKAVPDIYVRYYKWRKIPDALIDGALRFWSGDGDPFERRKLYLEWAAAEGFEERQAVECSPIFNLFARNPADCWAEIMDQVVHVHAKFYGVTDDGIDPSVDHEAIVPQFVTGGYTGYISSEWEGHQVSDEDALAHVERHQAMMRRILAAAG